jgi:transposase
MAAYLRMVSRGRRGNVVNVLWTTGDGLCLLAKRLERGRLAPRE